MSVTKIKRRGFLKGLLGAVALPTALKAGDSDVSVLKAKDVPKEVGRHIPHKPKYLRVVSPLMCTTGEVISSPPTLLSAEQQEQINAINLHLFDGEQEALISALKKMSAG